MTPIVLAFIFILVWSAMLGAMLYYAIETIILKYIETKSIEQHRKKIYISHPYGGKEDNKSRVEQIIKDCAKMNENINYISPIHAFGFLYDTINYQTRLSNCLWLLSQCDEMWIYGDYKNSKGCLAEIKYAKENRIPYCIKDSVNN